MKRATPPSRTAREILLGCLWLGGDSLPGDLDKSAVDIGVVDGDLGVHLPVRVDAGLVEAVCLLRVAHSLLPGGGVVPGDPEAPEIPRAGAPVPVCVRVRAHHLLVREPVARVLAA